MNLKFTVESIGNIEKAKGDIPIENIIGDSTISTILLYITNGYVNEDGRVGTSKAVAQSILSEYLVDHDKTDFLLEVTEELVKAGFLDKSLDVEKLRQARTNKAEQVNDSLDSL